MKAGRSAALRFPSASKFKASLGYVRTCLNKRKFTKGVVLDGRDGSGRKKRKPIILRPEANPADGPGWEKELRRDHRAHARSRAER